MHKETMPFDFSNIKVKQPEKLHFGTAGIPLSAEPRNTLQGIREIERLGLDAMEMEFVHSVNLKDDAAAEIYEHNKKQGAVLTAHGSYYINLNALEKEKRGASRARVLQAADICRKAGGYSMVFHAGFYLGMEKESAYAAIREQMKKIVAQLQDAGNEIWVRPETTGKPTQWGDLAETIRLSQEVEQVMPCVDFAHLHARTNGKYNTPEEFHAVLSEIENGMGKDGLSNMHIHLSGIAYGEKGEKHHLILQESDFGYEELVKVWKEFRIKGTVVCESPNLEGDALLLKKAYDRA